MTGIENLEKIDNKLYAENIQRIIIEGVKERKWQREY